MCFPDQGTLTLGSGFLQASNPQYPHECWHSVSATARVVRGDRAGVRYLSGECDGRECGRNSNPGASHEPGYTAVHVLQDWVLQDWYLKQGNHKQMGRRKQPCLSIYLFSFCSFCFVWLWSSKWARASEKVANNGRLCLRVPVRLLATSEEKRGNGGFERDIMER